MGKKGIICYMFYNEVLFCLVFTTVSHGFNKVLG